ncbi:MAG: carboxypeptidase-like regulatory domain-containing protein [Flavobacteriales bacterium]
MRAPLLLCLLPFGAVAQTPISGRVLDAATHEPLPYCNVILVGSQRSTLTNAEGAFSIAADTLADSLRFAYVGYRPLVLAASTVQRRNGILLHPSAHQLTQFVATANTKQYDRVARVAKALRSIAPYAARSYFEMETHLDERPVEVVECFYNGRFSGARTDGLDLKQGRIGIAPMGDRYFVSLNTTKAITLFDPTERNAHFPTSPFQWPSAKKLRKAYRVELVSTSTDEALDHLRMTPRDSSGIAFTVDLWLSAVSDAVEVIELHCTDCARHPFLPLWSEHAINSVDLRIRQTWRAWNGRNVLDHLELVYTLAYANPERPERIDTKAVLHLFDPGGAFILPLFEYDQEQPDYRKITMQPYDTLFWDRAPTLVRTAQQERDRDFLQRNGLLTGSSAPGPWKKSGFFESNCAWWSADKRVSLKSLPPPPEDATRPAGFRSQGAAAPISQVNLEAQLYLDMDTTGGQLRVFTATALDGFRSYYLLPEERHTDAFINIFFDLCEMERRTLQEQLLQPGITAERARGIHSFWTDHMNTLTRHYLKETSLGADRVALAKWNARVKEALGIDNMALFGL